MGTLEVLLETKAVEEVISLLGQVDDAGFRELHGITKKQKEQIWTLQMRLREMLREETDMHIYTTANTG